MVWTSARIPPDASAPIRRTTTSAARSIQSSLTWNRPAFRLFCFLLPTFGLASAMPVHLTILGSGSAGNCAYVESDEARILVDAGFSFRQIRQRLATIGRAPENLTAILITHEHSDHVQGLAALTQKIRIPIYCNRL